MKRRRFIAGSAVGAGTFLAGCSSVLGGTGDGSLPSYHTSIPAGSVDESTSMVYLDVEALFGLGYLDDGADTPTSTPTPTPTPTDSGADSAAPLVSAPLVGSLFVTLFGFTFGLAEYGDVGERLGDQLDPERVDSREAVDVSSVLFTPDGVVVEGDFDAAAYAEDLPESFVEAESRDGVAIHEDDEGSAAVAVGDDTLVLQVDGSGDGTAAREAIGRVLDARAGEVDRFVDRSPDVEWALRTAGSHEFVIASVGDNEVEGSGSDDRTYNPVAGTPLEGVSTSVLVSGASVRTSDGEPSGARADTALAHPGDPVEPSAVEDAYSGSEADVSVSASEGENGSENTQRVHVGGDFERETFGL